MNPLRAGADALSVVTVSGEPTVDDARAASEAARAMGADVVVAIGGGSPIDLAKAAAVLATNGGDPMEFIEVVGRGQPITRAPLPLVAVPTTAGTGAEVTANAVLSVPEHAVKASLRNPLMIPQHAVIDPELTLDCPPAVTAAAGMDALIQCLEPYVSAYANPMTDSWARMGMMAAGRSPWPPTRTVRTCAPAPTCLCAACWVACRWRTRNSAPCTDSLASSAG